MSKTIIEKNITKLLNKAYENGTSFSVDKLVAEIGGGREDIVRDIVYAVSAGEIVVQDDNGAPQLLGPFNENSSYRVSKIVAYIQARPDLQPSLILEGDEAEEWDRVAEGYEDTTLDGKPVRVSVMLEPGEDGTTTGRALLNAAYTDEEIGDYERDIFLDIACDSIEKAWSVWDFHKETVESPFPLLLTEEELNNPWPEGSGELDITASSGVTYRAIYVRRDGQDFFQTHILLESYTEGEPPMVGPLLEGVVCDAGDRLPGFVEQSEFETIEEFFQNKCDAYGQAPMTPEEEVNTEA